jgi:2-dehydropantoate 2-reductase
MGGVIAALLDRAGHEVEVTARGAGLAAIREHGIHLTGAWGDHTALVAAGERLGQTPELAIVATKAMDAAAAARTNADTLRGVPVVVLQNGLGGLEAVAAELPHSPMIGALSLIAACLTAPGEVTVTAPAGTWLGSTSEAGAVSVASAAAILGDALPVTVLASPAEFVGARWTKLVINQVNALPAITGLSVQEVIGDRRLRRIMVRSMREAVRVALARGIRFVTVNNVTHRSLWVLAHAPLWVGQLVPLRLRAYLGSVPNPGSTLQSIRRGQPSEIDYLNGAVVAAAEGTGVRTPVNAALTVLVHEVERSGTFRSPAQVVAALL